MWAFPSDPIYFLSPFFSLVLSLSVHFSVASLLFSTPSLNRFTLIFLLSLSCTLCLSPYIAVSLGRSAIQTGRVCRCLPNGQIPLFHPPYPMCNYLHLTVNLRVYVQSSTKKFIFIRSDYKIEENTLSMK